MTTKKTAAKISAKPAAPTKSITEQLREVAGELDGKDAVTCEKAAALIERLADDLNERTAELQDIETGVELLAGKMPSRMLMRAMLAGAKGLDGE